jgi:hypothetical protein
MPPTSGIDPHAAPADDLFIAAPHAARGRWRMVALLRMTDIHVGDVVTYEGRALRVRGISPMSASPRRVLLEDIDSGEQIEALCDELEAADDSTA